MSAVEEYRALIHESQYNRVVRAAIVVKADAAIAELEAELAFSQDQRIGEIDRFNRQVLRAELAEAELEEAKLARG